MNTLTKFALASGGAFALALTFSTPVAAGTSQDILVTSPAEMKSWQQTATRDLNRKLALGDKYGKGRSAEGIVQVRFTLDANGAPTNLQTYANTAGPVGERAAKWAVRRMRSLDNAPIANVEGRMFQANVIFAKGMLQKEELIAQLAKSERMRLAALGGADPVIQLGY